MRGIMGKNYAVLLRCPMQDQDTWVVLQDRTETLQQILGMPWDFECSIHGVQRELPVAANENGPPTNAANNKLRPPAPKPVKPQRTGAERAHREAAEPASARARLRLGAKQGSVPRRDLH